MLTIWTETFQEGQTTAKQHNKFSTDLKSLASEIHEWRKSRYFKSGSGPLSAYKVVDDMKNGFSTAQKDHKKAMQKLNAYWKGYKANLADFENYVQKRNKAKGSDVKKYEAKIQTSQSAGERAVAGVMARLEEVNKGKDEYMKKMKVQFSLSDKEELQRMKFFQHQLSEFLRKANILCQASQKERLLRLNSLFTPQQDLLQWSQLHGPGQDIIPAWPSMPQFHSFNPSHVISGSSTVKKDKKKDKKDNKKNGLSKSFIASVTPTGCENNYEEIDQDYYDSFDEDFEELFFPRKTEETKELYDGYARVNSHAGHEDNRYEEPLTVRRREPQYESVEPENMYEEIDQYQRLEPAYQVSAIESIKQYRAIADFDSPTTDELSLRKGDVLIMTHRYSPRYNYYEQVSDPTTRGYVDSHYLEEITDREPAFHRRCTEQRK